MFLRKASVITFLLIISGLIGFLFWQQEVQYSLPTPIPKNYEPPTPNSSLVLPASLQPKGGRPRFLHFFNPDCPCSRFNIDHFNNLVRTYQQEVDFVIIIPEGADATEAANMLVKGLLIIQDSDNSISEACGVYASPQAVILTTKGQLYYRGNYNKARYCTQKNSNYAQQAIIALLDQKPAPSFGLFSSRAYGCEFRQETIFSTLTF